MVWVIREWGGGGVVGWFVGCYGRGGLIGRVVPCLSTKFNLWPEHWFMLALSDL